MIIRYDMDSVFRNGQMERDTQESGEMICLMVKEKCIIILEIFMTESGRITLPMAKELIFKRMERLIQENGYKINLMDLE